MSGPVDPGTERGQSVQQQEIELAVRRYVSRMARRYLPFAIGVVTLALVAVTVPTKTLQPGGTSMAAGAPAPADSGGGSAGEAGAPGQGATSVAAGTASVAGSSTGATASVGGTGSGASGGGAMAADNGGVTASSGAATVGGSARSAGGGVPVSRAGVKCTAGARQVSWSKWTPACEGRWSGNNGGATSHGVTATTITMSYRISNSQEGAALQAIAGAGASDVSETAYEHDLRVYINYFNTQFELYGRKVVLKPFNGQGDYLQEYQGQDIPGAQADAQSAYSLGAFGDMSMSELITTTPYAQALAANRVMSFGGAPASQSTYSAMQPYGWNPLAVIDLLGTWMGNLTCQRLNGLPAIFSPSVATKQRVFGLLQPDTPDFNEVGDIVVHLLSGCRAPLAERIRYSPNLSQQSQDMSNAMIQLQSKGVTTVLCLCDGTGNILATDAASSQNYTPEWVTNGIADEDSQRFAKDESDHAISPNGAAYGFQSDEALRVYKLADPSNAHQLPEDILDWAYLEALFTFDGLQAAGPNLNPYTFEKGMWSLPANLPFVQWQQGKWDGVRALPVLWFNQNAKSLSNGQAGAWQLCTGADGAFRTVDDRAAYGPYRTQLHCFGK